MGSGDDTLRTQTRERLALLMKTQASAQRFKARGVSASELGQQQSVPMAQARAIVDDWPEAPKTVGVKLLEHYGAPHEATPTKLFWYRNGLWARTELSADEVVHNFPTPHTDFLTQYVDYPIDLERATDLVKFDGSVIVDRTAGQLGARCDHEPFNVLTLNLAVEIMEGRRTIEQARDLYAETAAAFVLGRDAPYAERLRFDVPVPDAPDPDEPVIADDMLRQMKEKLKDLLGGGDVPQ
ncbi:MAG TPA: hypothetical protein VHF25_06070 [Nitriliruptorales bacterium]|nr:hypothetical protein [Nitriliruptorales bacterium]